MAERRKASNAPDWSSAIQPGRSAKETIWKAGESGTERTLGRRASVFLFGRDQLPVRIARARVAGEGPDILDLGDRFRIAVYDSAGIVAGRRDQLADDAQRDMSLAILHLGRD